MDFSEPRTWLWSAAILYLVTFLSGVIQSRRGLAYPAFLLLALLAVGYFLQTRGLYLRGLSTHACPLGNGMERIQFIAWSFVLTYLIIRLIFKLQLLGLFTSGLAAVLSFISLFPKALILIIGRSLVTRNYFKTPGLNYMPQLQYLATEFSLF